MVHTCFHGMYEKFCHLIVLKWNRSHQWTPVSGIIKPVFWKLKCAIRHVQNKLSNPAYVSPFLYVSYSKILRAAFAPFFLLKNYKPEAKKLLDGKAPCKMLIKLTPSHFIPLICCPIIYWESHKKLIYWWLKLSSAKPGVYIHFPGFDQKLDKILTILFHRQNQRRSLTPNLSRLVWDLFEDFDDVIGSQIRSLVFNHKTKFFDQNAFASSITFRHHHRWHLSYLDKKNKFLWISFWTKNTDC